MMHALCSIDEIPDGGTREFQVVGRYIFALREGDEVRVYLNLCPHLGTPLNWEPDSFLDREGTYIRCSNHGALFLRDTGECIAGPCKGMPLSSVPVSIEDGTVHVRLMPRQPYQPFTADD